MCDVKKISQFSTEVEPVTYSPVFMGNECIIVAYQNQRRLEDLTLLSFCRLTRNGDLIPLEYYTNDPAVFNLLLNELRAQSMHKRSLPLVTSTTCLNELRARLLHFRFLKTLESEGQNFCTFSDLNKQAEPMDLSPSHPFHLTKSTSTTELTSQRVNARLCLCCDCCKLRVSSSLAHDKKLISRGCNTSMESIDVLENVESPKTSKLDVFEKRRQKKDFDDLV